MVEQGDVLKIEGINPPVVVVSKNLISKLILMIDMVQAMFDYV